MKQLFGSANETGIDTTQFDKSNQRYFFTGTGRVDNRKDLFSTLAAPQSTTDEDLLWLSFQKWGKDAPKHILGDWAFAAYDTTEKELFLARDQHGYTAMHYTTVGDTFYFSSSIKPLLKLKKPLVNERQVIGRIAIWSSKGERETDFKGIFPLNAAHWLSYKKGQIEIKQYWFPENIAVRNYKNDADYAVELFEIFKEAVACRLVGEKPVASMLSGGLDSGSVASMAAFLLQKENKPLTTYSHVPLFRDKVAKDGKRNFFDETDRILSTAGFHQNIKPILMDSKDMSPIAGMRAYLDVSDHLIHGAANSSWMFEIFNTAAQSGFGALLTGENGNGALSNAGLPRLLPWSHPSFRNNPKALLKELVRPLYNKLKPKSKDFEDYLGKSFLNQHIIDEYQILEDVRANQTGFGAKGYKNANEAMVHLIELARYGRCTNGGNVSNYFGIEKRDPTADLRVLEYCLSIPNEAFINEKGINRHIVRKMMAGIMSPKTLYEQKIGRQSADIEYRVLAHPAEMDEMLNQLFKNPYFCHIFNVKQMTTFWQDMKDQKPVSDYQVNSLMKAVMAGLFFEKNNF